MAPALVPPGELEQPNEGRGGAPGWGGARPDGHDCRILEHADAGFVSVSFVMPGWCTPAREAPGGLARQTKTKIWRFFNGLDWSGKRI